ncbi:MAG: hypothetical protein PHD06_09040 [Bacteroidales bacterium]|jgi:hypothetical protein|nr:hypothetical protein [Bacteroidales bacterium]MDY0198254.1 hypothetical protein [Tenuifilaceae bacterium]
MHFYKPGPFEDYIAKLSAISTCPIPDVWEGISKELDRLDSHKKLRIIKFVSIAACMLILISIGVPTLIISSSKILPSEFSHKLTLSSNRIEPLQPLTASSIAFVTKTNLENEVMPKLQINNKNEDFDNDFIPPIEEVEVLKSEAPLANEDKEANKNTMPLLATIGNINNNNKGEVTITKAIEKKGKKSWSLIGYLNPAFSYHTYGAFNYKQNPSETGAWMLGGDLLFRKKIGSYFSLYSGISISPTGQNIDNLILLKNQSAEFDMDYLYANTSYGTVSLDNNSVAISNFSNLPNASEPLLRSSMLNTASLQQRFYYMQVPFIVSSNVRAGIFDIEFKLGCAAGVLVNNKFKVFSTRGNFTGKTEEIRKYNASAIAAVSVSIPVTHQVDLIVEPNIQLHFNPLNYNYAITYPFTSSIKVGVGYNF